MIGRQSPRNGHTTTNYDSLSVYAKAYARQSGQHLKVLGEASFKYLSGAVENWRAAGADSAGVKLSPRSEPAHHAEHMARAPACSRTSFADCPALTVI